MSRERALDLSTPQIMGILNMTPDSFSDGGLHESIEQAVTHADQMIAEGADLIDIGGESTRPGAERVDAKTQRDRVVPIITEIASRHDVPISIDTTRAEVASAAIDAGASIINDVSAGREDADMLPLAAERGCGLVLMHRLRPPEEDCWSDAYEHDPDYGGDVVVAVRDWLLARADVVEAAGVDRASICLDPGLGFGKSVAQNWELVERFASFVDTGYPILAAASRKSFIGAATGVTVPADRGAGSAAVTVLQVAAGARLLRVHDVALHVAAAAESLSAT
jgi:dihydropteroate synthase